MKTSTRVYAILLRRGVGGIAIGGHMEEIDRVYTAYRN
jgi:hypothetical protein